MKWNVLIRRKGSRSGTTEASASSPLSGASGDRVDEGLGLEDLEQLLGLARAHVEHGKSELARDREDSAAARGAVQFGDDDAGA